MPFHSFRPGRRSIRLKGYDYSAMGSYFVTICVRNRECVFGDVLNGEMKPSAIGEIVNQCWVLLSDDFANVGLDAFQIMPNHFHGIVVLFGPDRRDLIGRDLINQIPTGDSPNPTDNQIPTGLDESRFGPVPGWQQMKNPKQTLGKIIRHFKAKATRQIHEAGFADFQWQQRFHDRIIRGEDELNRIRAYIQSNPSKWEGDAENPHRDEQR